MMRQPIVTILAHVDHGKTTLLDKIRQTAVAAKEAGGITQAIGTTEIPKDTIENICGPLLKKFNFKVTVPGLLFIDTPGHAAFTTLRKRGGSIADIVVLVVDIIEGIMPQTIESLGILKETKTPFVIVLNKIDRLTGWRSKQGSFLENYDAQSQHTQELFEEAFYKVVAQFSEQGFSIERFDRIEDFTKTVAVVPLSGKTGEGIPDLLSILIGLSQQFLKKNLVTTSKSEGIIMEVKDVIGLGTTVDVIIYDGTIKKNNYLVISGKKPMITKIKALLIPNPLKDIRTEKKFHNINECKAACGIKIVATGLENAVAGCVIKTSSSTREAEDLLKELEKNKEEAEISTCGNGLVLKADTIGSLEALLNIFKNHEIKEAKIGNVTREDVIKASSNPELQKFVICFNMHPSEEIKNLAKEHDVSVIESDIIYHLFDDYEKMKDKKIEAIKQREIEGITRPGKIKILPGCVFRSSNPAIVGCEVLGGLVKPDFGLFKENKRLGEIKQIQLDGENVPEAKPGDKVAISIKGAIVGRHIHENDVLYSDVNSDEYKILKKHETLLSKSEKAVLEEIYEIKRKNNPCYGI